MGEGLKTEARMNPIATECAIFGEKASFHHVGLAVESIQEVNRSCEIFVEKTQRVSIAFILLNGVRIELLEPLGDNSPISRSLRNGTKLLHLCYEVPDLEAALELCKEAGFHRLWRPRPAPLYDNRKVAWVYSKHYGLFELLERDRVPAADRTQAEGPAVNS